MIVASFTGHVVDLVGLFRAMAYAGLLVVAVWTLARPWRPGMRAEEVPALVKRAWPWAQIAGLGVCAVVSRRVGAPELVTEGLSTALAFLLVWVGLQQLLQTRNRC